MIFKQNKLSGSTGKVYQYLFDAIIYNELKPGEALSEQEIAAKLAISRTPVREALVILESEGMIVRYPSRGCFVSQITVRDVEEIFELRAQLELCALRNSYIRISDLELETLEKKLVELSAETPPEDYFETDRELHGLILCYSGNSRLVDFIGILNAQIERVRVISANRPHRLIESRAEHLAIVRAMRDRDLAKTEQLLAMHIENIQNNTMEVCKFMNMAHV